MAIAAPPWTRHALAAVAGFLALLALFHWEAMHALDARLASWLQDEPAALSRDIVLVDVPRGAGLGEFRGRLGAMLQDLAAHPDNLPRVVGLDVWFDAETPVVAPILAGLAALQARRVPVMGAVNIHREHGDGFDAQYEKRHLLALYGPMDGVGHSAFNQPRAGGGWAYYVPCPGQGWPMALSILLADRQDLCLAEEGAEHRVLLGPPLAPGQAERMVGHDPACPAHWRRYGGDCLTQAPDLRNRIVIVGRLADDVSPYPGRSGPEILAWATNDLLGAGGRGLLNDNRVHLGLTLAVAAVGLGLFTGLLRFIRPWSLQPWRIALLAAAVALLLPLGLMALARLLGHDFSQILLPILTLALTLALATHFRSLAVRAEARAREALPDREFVAYDLFVSYRHRHGAWVDGILKPLLGNIRRVDGRKLAVFIDAEGIHAGKNWEDRLQDALHHARVFLPVLTPDYFDLNAAGYSVCAWEMKVALRRQMKNAMEILPIFHGGYDPEQDTPADLPDLGSIQGWRSGAPDLEEKVRAGLLAVLDRPRAGAEAAVAGPRGLSQTQGTTDNAGHEP